MSHVIQTVTRGKHQVRRTLEDDPREILLEKNKVASAKKKTDEEIAKEKRKETKILGILSGSIKAEGADFNKALGYLKGSKVIKYSFDNNGFNVYARLFDWSTPQLVRHIHKNDLEGISPGVIERLAREARNSGRGGRLDGVKKAGDGSLGGAAAYTISKDKEKVWGLLLGAFGFGKATAENATSGRDAKGIQPELIISIIRELGKTNSRQAVNER